MGESKVCSSCGNTIPVEAVFCPNCGSVQQQKPEEPAQAPQPAESVQAAVEDIAPVQQAEMNEIKPEPAQPVRPAPVQQPQQKPVQPVRQDYVSQAAAPQMQRPQGYPQQAQQPAQGYQQPAQGYQQPYYAQPQQAAAPAKPKKKFPWVFTVAWVVMFVFLGIWGCCLFMLPGYQVPEVTVDTVRILTFAVSFVLLIYTMNLRLITKKFKVVPTILTIIFLLASLFMYVSFEMTDADWIHNAISPITDALFQVN